MGYKQKIDGLRKNKEAINYNLELIADDLMFFDEDKVKELLEEHAYYTQMSKQIDSIIKISQPWYRKLFKVPY